MNNLRNVSRTVAGLAAALAVVLTFSATASPAAVKHNVFWVDLAGDAWQAPDFVYFVANSGGQVRHVKWNGWGARKAVGWGIYKDTSASYPGKLQQGGPAILVASKPIRCVPDFGDKKNKTIRVYRKIRLIYPNGKGGSARSDVSATAGFLACK